MRQYFADDDVVEGSVHVQASSDNDEPMTWSQEVRRRRGRNERQVQVKVDVSPILPMLSGALFMVSLALLLITLFVVGVL